MSYFRHAVRHIQVSVEKRVDQVLRDAGWFGPAVPFGAKPVRLVMADTRETVKPNIVALIFGDESEEFEAQLGSGLKTFTMGVGVDVIGETAGVTTAMAADLMDGLTGRNPAFSPFLPVVDHTTGVVRVDWSAEFTRTQRLKPDPMEWRPDWLALSTMLEVHYGGE